MSAAWCRYDPAARRLTLVLHVQPGAKRCAVAGTHGDALKIRIAAPATDNRANAALVRFLGDALDVPRSAIVVRRGAASRRKVVEVTGGPELVGRLSEWA